MTERKRNILVGAVVWDVFFALLLFGFLPYKSTAWGFIAVFAIAVLLFVAPAVSFLELVFNVSEKLDKEKGNCGAK